MEKNQQVAKAFTIKETPANNKLIATILFSFLSTFVLSRLTVYFVLDRLIPNFFLTIRGVHIHHFTYGVFILAVTELYVLLKRPTPELPVFKAITVLYGAGLALTFDEFGMWIRLVDDYWIRQSYDAVIIVGLLLLNIRYYRWITFALGEISSLVRHFFKRT